MLGRALFSRALPAGRVTIAGTLIASLVFGSALVSYFKVDVPTVHADDVTTSITVLNTPPTWTVAAEESTESSTSTPTNAGSSISWVGTATDSSGDSYFMIVCKTNGAPTANASAPPSCNGGVANQWAISATTTSGNQATAATTTREYFPFENESNDWYAFVCDFNAALPRCYNTWSVGSGSTQSPFVVNHPPYFNNITNNGPIDPASNITWTSTSFDNDSLGGSNDQVTLVVCRSNDFTGTYCGAAGGWATSSAATTNAATTTFVSAPRQDATYNAYVYLYDNHGLVATSSRHGFNSSFVVNNVAPNITTSTIALVDTDNAGFLELTTAGGRTDNFKVTFTVTDANSCQNSSSAAEFTSATTSVFRSGVGTTSCGIATDFDSNDCYPSISNMTNFSCTQDGASCSGSSDPDATWTCTFGLWYNADPTHTSSFYIAQDWSASVSVTDDDGANSFLTEASTHNELLNFLAFDVSSTSIPYGSLEPGQTHSVLGTSTDLIARGNTGLDQDVYGDTMCTTWSALDSCDTNGVNPANDIPIGNQKVATSSVSYGSAQAYTMTGSTTPVDLAIRVPKTTATSSPNTRYAWWGMGVPGAITTAGAYSGQNVLTGKVSNSSFW